MTKSKAIHSIRKFEKTMLVVVLLLLTMPTSSQAQDTCPKIGSPTSVAMEFQLFSAFRTGFDGYEAPCELKCLGKEKCQNKCQAKRGLEFLAKQMDQLKNRHQLSHCSSLTLNCIKQCENLGPDCAKICESSTVAEN